MGFSKTLLLLVLSLSCLIIQTISAASAPSSSPAPAAALAAWRRKAQSPSIMVVNLCRDSTNAKLCVKTILPAIKGRFNPIKALEAEIMETKTQVLKTKEQIKTLIADPKTSLRNARSLETCDGQYSSMLDSIQESMSSLEASRDPAEAKFKLSALISYLNTCDDIFSEDNRTNPIAAYSKVLSDLGGNCLDIIKAIEDRQMKRLMRRFGGKLPPPPPEISFKNDPCYNVVGTCSSS